MNLSEKALKELKQILSEELKDTPSIDDQDIKDFGYLVMTVLNERLRLDIQTQEKITISTTRAI